MSLKPQHEIDIRLAQMYSDKVTVNLDRTSSMSVDDFWKSMQLIAVNNKSFVNFKK